MKWLFFVSIIVLVFSVIAVFFDYFAISIPILSGLFELINLSSIFISFICVVAVIAIWKHYSNDRHRAIISTAIYVLNIAIVNKLYMNSTWNLFGNWIKNIPQIIKNWNWPIILITGFCLIVAITMIAWGISIWKNHKASGAERNNTIATEAHSSQNNDLNKTEDSVVQENSHITKEENSDADQNTFVTPPTLAYSLVCILLIFPTIAIIQYVCYRVLKWDVVLPDSMTNSVDVLIYIGTISLGIICALLIWISKRQSRSTSYFQNPSLLAFISEIIIIILFFCGANIIDKNLLNSFLNALTNNVLVAAVIIPIVLFVILYIGFSLFLNIFFDKGKKEENSWFHDAKLKLDEIEMRVVMLVLNLFIGIINIFLLIPDFLGEMGALLFSKDNLFPTINESDLLKKNKEEGDKADNKKDS